MIELNKKTGKLTLNDVVLYPSLSLDDFFIKLKNYNYNLIEESLPSETYRVFGLCNQEIITDLIFYNKNLVALRIYLDENYKDNNDSSKEEKTKHFFYRYFKNNSVHKSGNIFQLNVYQNLWFPDEWFIRIDYVDFNKLESSYLHIIKKVDETLKKYKLEEHEFSFTDENQDAFLFIVRKNTKWECYFKDKGGVFFKKDFENKEENTDKILNHIEFIIQAFIINRNKSIIEVLDEKRKTILDSIIKNCEVKNQKVLIQLQNILSENDYNRTRYLDEVVNFYALNSSNLDKNLFLKLTSFVYFLSKMTGKDPIFN